MDDPEGTAKQNRGEERRQARLALIERLEEEDAPDLIGPMESCGDPLPMVCTHCGETHEGILRCKKRYCPECQPKQAIEKVMRWQRAIESIQWPLFITLTMGNTSDPESIKFIKKRWSAFRRRKLIKERIKGGVATFEITNTGRGWHPHIHAIADCRWLSLDVPEPLRTDSPEVVAEKCSLAKAELSALWADQIKQPFAIVDARRVYDGRKIVTEVIKYAVKGSDLLNSPDPIAPLLRAIKGTRMLAGWGSMFPLPELDPDEPAAVACKSCGCEKSLLPAEIVSYLIRS